MIKLTKLFYYYNIPTTTTAMTTMSDNRLQCCIFINNSMVKNYSNANAAKKREVYFRKKYNEQYGFRRNTIIMWIYVYVSAAVYRVALFTGSHSFLNRFLLSFVRLLKRSNYTEFLRARLNIRYAFCIVTIFLNGNDWLWFCYYLSSLRILLLQIDIERWTDSFINWCNF